jgi:hypothetical protein
MCLRGYAGSGRRFDGIWLVGVDERAVWSNNLVNLIQPFAFYSWRRRLYFLIISGFPFSLSYSLVRDGGGLHSRHLGGIVVVLDAASVGNFVSQSMTQWRKERAISHQTEFRCSCSSTYRRLYRHVLDHEFRSASHHRDRLQKDVILALRVATLSRAK